VKKITRKQGGGYTATTYIDGAFEYTKESGIGEQNILHVMGGATRRIGDALGDSTPAIKYNLADHLGSSCVQLDTNGTTVSLEEYYPFGETSFGSYAKKRYRFCGKEKDEESGLYYYGMRYYSPWTCRFINVDPLAGKTIFMSSYAYANCNPIMMNDPTGGEAEGIPEGSSENSSTTASQNSDNTTTTEEDNTTTQATDTSGVSTYYYKETDSSGTESIKSFTVNDGKSTSYYRHDKGNIEYQGNKYIEIVSKNSIKGLEGYGIITDDVLVNNYSEWALKYADKLGVKNWSDVKLANQSGSELVSNGSLLDVQNNGELRDLALKSGAPLKTAMKDTNEIDTFGEPIQKEFSYTNSLYLLPNGKYGNANEAGDYFIGFAYGYADSSLSAAWLAQRHANIIDFGSEEPWKIALEKEGQSTGSVLDILENYRPILVHGGISSEAYTSVKNTYNYLVDKYSNHPIIKQRQFSKWQF
jgi:RHS repeat-associated protein